VLRRPLSVCLALLACLALPSAAQAAFKTGISDQQAGTFSNPLFSALGFTSARYITPYDVMNLAPGDKNRVALHDWITGARMRGQDILVSFEHSHTRGRERRIPNTREYSNAIKRFMRAYPFVRSLSPWNEANRCQRTIGSGASRIVVGQPICRRPRQAARYYNTTAQACRQLRRRCRIVALDVLDENNVTRSLRYIRTFRRYAKPRPRYWGLHNYSDTNRFSQRRTRAMIRATGRGEIWLTETGGIVKLGRSFPFNVSRATRALGCTFRIARDNRRIKRVYIYNFNAATPASEFDAGLINLDGSKRPGYEIVRKRKPRTCRR
jgi:hypothetical protein